MSIEALFDHTCDIYHIVEGENNPGYNLPSSPSFSYPSVADENGVQCHFTVRVGNNTSMVQNEPQNKYSAHIKLNLPVGADIRLHDKVVDCDTKLEYTAVTPPRNIRGNHSIVYIERTREQKPL